MLKPALTAGKNDWCRFCGDAKKEGTAVVHYTCAHHIDVCESCRDLIERNGPEQVAAMHHIILKEIPTAINPERQCYTVSFLDFRKSRAACARDVDCMSKADWVIELDKPVYYNVSFSHQTQHGAAATWCCCC
jgi:hypothetical protein